MESPARSFRGGNILRAIPTSPIPGWNPLLHYELLRQSGGPRFAFSDRGGGTRSAKRPVPGEGKARYDFDPLCLGRTDDARQYLSGHELCRSGEGERRLRGMVRRRRNWQTGWKQIEDFDVLVIWRTSWDETLARAVDAMHAAGKTVVFDCDDLMTEPNLAQTSIIDGIRTQNLTEGGVRGHYARIRQTMLAADICFASTQELAFHMRLACTPTDVLPNGFSQYTHDLSRRTARAWRAKSRWAHSHRLRRRLKDAPARFWSRDGGGRANPARASGMPARAVPHLRWRCAADRHRRISVAQRPRWRESSGGRFSL